MTITPLRNAFTYYWHLFLWQFPGSCHTWYTKRFGRVLAAAVDEDEPWPVVFAVVNYANWEAEFAEILEAMGFTSKEEICHRD